MNKTLLFIPDISGFTQFVQNTEAEHSQHVIAELLEVLINANTLDLQLAEIEGDALFFFLENYIPSQEMLLAQIEAMFTAFYSHLNILDKNRICSCKACSSAPKLQLKIIAHTGEIQFLNVKGNHKPFGNVVIEAHRLLKNNVASDNYTLISNDLVKEIELSADYKSKLFNFNQGSDTYDTKEIGYHYSIIEISKLKLIPFDEPKFISFESLPNLKFNKEFQVSATELIEYITNYKYRHFWVKGVDEFIYNENEVTRFGSPHVCVINGKQLNFTTITKKGKPGQIVYGELTETPSIIDQLYNFYIITPISNTSCSLEVETYWKVKSIFKKIIISLFVKKVFQKNTNSSLKNLQEFLNTKS